MRLWSHNPDKVALLRKTRRVDKPLAISIPESVDISSDLAETVSQAEVLLFCCNAQSMRSVALQVKNCLAVPSSVGAGKSAERPAKIAVSAAKGIELDTFKRMSAVLSEVLPGMPVCALSGPNLAAEVLEGKPTASVIACDEIETARFVQAQLNVQTFRVYTNNDLPGVELGGSLKNIIAIAAGTVDGLKLGTNAKAALMTRGLAEMTRLAVALGGKPSTLAGLSGMGDLVATCYSDLSRNYRLGYKLAQGETLNSAEKELGAVAEGVTTARAVCELSQKLDIELPIAEQVDRTLRGISTPEKAIMTLMARPLASE